jgi:hypothetical protein
MKLKAYSLYDSAAQAFSQPFFMHNDGMAIRAFQDNVNSKEPSHISQHPEQFTLFHVADWDDKNAALEPVEPKSLALGVEMVNPENKKFTIEELKKLFEENNVIPIKEAK